MSGFDFLYAGSRRNPGALGSLYNPPKRFPHGEDVLVATVPKAHKDSDGFDVEVYECRMPATFWKVVAKPTADSMGDVQPGWEISTGSGGDEMLDLMGRIARLASEGMIGCDPLPARITGEREMTDKIITLRSGLTMEQQRDEWRSLYMDLCDQYAELAEAKRESAEWKEAAAQANAAIEHYQGERDKAERENAALRACLRYYADEANWKPYAKGGVLPFQGTPYDVVCHRDAGSAARAVLATSEQPPSDVTSVAELEKRGSYTLREMRYAEGYRDGIRAAAARCVDKAIEWDRLDTPTLVSMGAGATALAREIGTMGDSSLPPPTNRGCHAERSGDTGCPRDGELCPCPVGMKCPKPMIVSSGAYCQRPDSCENTAEGCPICGAEKMPTVNARGNAPEIPSGSAYSPRDDKFYP